MQIRVYEIQGMFRLWKVFEKSPHWFHTIVKKKKDSPSDFTAGLPNLRAVWEQR